VKRRAWLCKVVGFGLACRAAQAWGQTRPPTVGYLGPPVPDGPGHDLFDGLRAEMHQLGWVEGKNLRYEARLPGPVDSGTTAQRVATLARELAAANVDVIVAMSNGGAQAAKRASSIIPIVFLAQKPVENGLVSSLAHPGGNLTGMTYHIDSLMIKRMQLLTQAAPGLARVAYLSTNDAESDASARAAARTLNLELQLVQVHAAEDLERAIGAAPQPGAWVIDDYSLFINHMQRIVELIARTRKPAIYSANDWVQLGGLMSYSDDRKDVMRYVARYVDRILRGARPAELPVEQPTQFVLALNVKTARALSLAIPPSLMLRVDEVIE
jgi:putative ABC transport system substrate-binding protein